MLISYIATTGVKSYDVSLESQTADIVTDDSVPYSTLLEKIKKTGKKVNSAEVDGQSMDV
jgi:copper chaperone